MATLQPNPLTAQPANSRAPITLVTAYFAMPRRSRSVSEYHAWMANLLPFVTWPMVIFCDEASLDTIKRLRGHKPAVYCVTGLQAFSVYRYRDILHAHIAQRLARPNSSKAGFDAALVWHEKANFVRRAIEANPFASEMFFWCDIGFLRRGIFRPSERIEWPNERVCRAVFGEQVGFFARRTNPGSSARLPPWVTAVFWGGLGAPTRRFCEDYYRLLEQRITDNPAVAGGAPVPPGQGYFNEETLMSAMAETRAFNMRVVTKDALSWPGWVKYLGRIKRSPAAAAKGGVHRPRRVKSPTTESGKKRGAGNTFISLYLLRGGRFPWACLGREIHLRSALSLLATRILR